MDRRRRGIGQAGSRGLLGRASECALLDQMMAAIRTGESRVLVVHGAPEVGKSALLEYAETSAKGLRVLRAVGVESEMELPFATLHRLCAPLLDLLEGLPVPQNHALETVFGMRAGSPAERFLVGLLQFPPAAPRPEPGRATAAPARSHHRPGSFPGPAT